MKALNWELGRECRPLVVVCANRSEKKKMDCLKQGGSRNRIRTPDAIVSDGYTCRRVHVKKWQMKVDSSASLRRSEVREQRSHPTSHPNDLTFSRASSGGSALPLLLQITPSSSGCHCRTSPAAMAGVVNTARLSARIASRHAPRYVSRRGTERRVSTNTRRRN